MEEERTTTTTKRKRLPIIAELYETYSSIYCVPFTGNGNANGPIKVHFAPNLNNTLLSVVDDNFQAGKGEPIAMQYTSGAAA